MTPLTHGRVLNIAIPIVMSNLTVPLLGLVDTGVPAHQDQGVKKAVGGEYRQAHIAVIAIG